MTISSSNRKAGPFTGNGITTSFPFTFKVFSASDVKVVLAVIATGVETVQALTTNYTVSLNADQNANPGGTVTMLSVPASTHTVTLTSQVPSTQSVDLQNNGGFYPSVINTALDKLTILIQQVTERVDRALLSAVSSVTPAKLPAPAATKVLAWNAAGTDLENVDMIAGQSALATALAAPTGSSLVGFIQSGTGAVATTVQTKLRESVSVLDFGAVGDGSDEYAEIAAAWNYCLANGKDLYFPAGTYSCEALSFPFGRVNGLIPSSLLDCLNITIYGDGPNTILKTASVTGADVIQINGAKNLHLRNFKVTATISGSASGSNGISVTGGYDNITIDHVWAENLPSVDATTFVDGGKALTIQTPVAGQTVECGTLKATHIYAKGCVYGFGLELDLVAASVMPTSIDVDIIAEDCWNAVVVSSGAATAPISANWNMGVRVRAQAINCMQDVRVARGHGVIVDAQIITTKTQAARILNYAGVKWLATNTTADVIGLYVDYAHASHIRVIGNKGDCSYKAIVGGATAGSSGLTGATWLSKIETDLLGTASVAEFGAINSGGDITNNCTLIVRNAAASPATAHYLPSRNNCIVYGSGYVLDQLLVRNKISFTDTDGLDTFGGEIGFDDEAVFIKQKNSSGASAEVLKVVDHTGAVVFSVRNDGVMLSAGRAAASAVATVNNVMPVYNSANVLVGYLPIYTTYTP